MFTRPADLRDDEVVVALADGWGLEVTDIEHAPVGFGSHHWCVTTPDGCRWFRGPHLRSRLAVRADVVARATTRALTARRREWSTKGLTTGVAGPRVVLNQLVEQSGSSAHPVTRRPP